MGKGREHGEGMVPWEKGGGESVGLWEGAGAVGRGSHHCHTMAKGSCYGAGTAARRRDCASGMGPHGGHGVTPRLPCKVRRRPPRDCALFQPEPIPITTQIQSWRPAQLRPAMPSPKRKPIGAAMEVAGARHGDPREAEGSWKGTEAPRSPGGLRVGHGSMRPQHPKYQPLRDRSSCSISSKAPGATGQSHGDTGVPHQGFKDPRD